CQIVVMIDKGAPITTLCKVFDTYGGFIAGPELPQSIAVGRSQTITMQVVRPPVADAVIRLKSSSPEIASVPDTVTLPRGATAVTFDVAVLRPGRTSIAMNAPNLPEVVIAPVSIIGYVPATPQVPERIGMIQGDIARFTLGAATLVQRDILATVVAANPKIAAVPRNVVLRGGNPATVEIYGTTEGTTELTITFDADAGSTTVKVPVTVAGAGKHRAVH
ncbi:MAG: hypothetical protein M3Q69_12600, partial [Acidobacteriota bacterium]|nr:hypothetical protein [Acidobacteriota bacterium]